MSETVKLTARDGHDFDAYVARPEGTPLAGLVLIQEIFGVNYHIRAVADGYAKDGFLVIAPAIFDRVERGVELDYVGEEGKKGYALMGQLKPEAVLLDIAAALAWVRGVSGKAKAGVIGYCFGGHMTWRSACELDPQAAVGYYAGGIGKVVDLTPQCPVMMHFGKLDTGIPLADVERLASLHPPFTGPEVQIFLYDAGHAFNRDVGASYDAESAMLARERSLAFLKEHLA